MILFIHISCRVRVRFFGKASHAAAAPWEGVNALDAVVASYNAISCFRQQMPPKTSIHGKSLWPLKIIS